MFDPYSYTFLNIPVDDFLVFYFPYYEESICTISLSNSRVEVHEGVIFISGREFLVQFSHGRYVMVCLRYKSLQETNYIAAPEIEYNRIIDLSVEGDRWEGDVWDNKPCGHGTEYDRYNNRLQKGMIFYEIKNENDVAFSDYHFCSPAVLCRSISGNRISRKCECYS